MVDVRCLICDRPPMSASVFDVEVAKDKYSSFALCKDCAKDLVVLGEARRFNFWACPHCNRNAIDDLKIEYMSDNPIKEVCYHCFIDAIMHMFRGGDNYLGITHVYDRDLAINNPELAWREINEYMWSIGSQYHERPTK